MRIKANATNKFRIYVVLELILEFTLYKINARSKKNTVVFLLFSFDCFYFCTWFDSFSFFGFSSNILLFAISNCKQKRIKGKRISINKIEKKESFWSLISRQRWFLCIRATYETNQTGQSGIVFNFPSTHRIFLDILELFSMLQCPIFFLSCATITNNFIMWWHCDRWQNGNGVHGLLSFFRFCFNVFSSIAAFFCSSPLNPSENKEKLNSCVIAKQTD